MSTQDTTLPPDWNNSRTLPTEPWKSPMHTMAERLEIADGAVSFRDDVIANLRRQLEEAKAAIAAQAQQPSYGSISDRAERGLDAGLWKAKQAQGVPAHISSDLQNLSRRLKTAHSYGETSIRVERGEFRRWAALIDSALAAAPQAEPAAPALSLDAVYSAWHSIGADIAGLDWSKFVALLAEPQPEREPLSREQIIKCWGEVEGTRHGYAAFARAIERAHGIGTKGGAKP